MMGDHPDLKLRERFVVTAVGVADDSQRGTEPQNAVANQRRGQRHGMLGQTLERFQ